MTIYCFLNKIFKKVLNCTQCYLKVIRIFPETEQYSYRLQLEESISYDINKVIIKIEKAINAKRK